MNQTGVWDNEEKISGHRHSENLARAIVTILMERQDEPVYDLGCGDGYYTGYFHSFNIDCTGFDGNPANLKPDDRIIKQDLTEPLKLNKKGAVICLEVAEHIPVQFENQVLDNIANNCSVKAIISWAVPGQGGLGHVNERENYYVIGRMQDKGFKMNFQETIFLRSAVEKDECHWFKNTLLVFDQQKTITA